MFSSPTSWVWAPKGAYFPHGNHFYFISRNCSCDGYSWFYYGWVPKDDMFSQDMNPFCIWPTRPHVHVLHVCPWVNSLRSKMIEHGSMSVEAAPFCMNMYLLGQQIFYSPSAQALSLDGGGACSGPCSNVPLIIYLQQNASKRLSERARGQVCSLRAERFSCRERLWLFITADNWWCLGFIRVFYTGF